MRFWVLSLVILFAIPTYAQNEEFTAETDLSFIGDLFGDLVKPKTSIELCDEKQEEIRMFIKGGAELLQTKETEMAWRYLDRAFFESLTAIEDCSDDEFQARNLEEIFDIINELDDAIACQYHMTEAETKFSLAQAYSRGKTPEEAEFYVRGAIYSTQEALRFCTEESGNYQAAVDNLDMLQNKALKNYE